MECDQAACVSWWFGNIGRKIVEFDFHERSLVFRRDASCFESAGRLLGVQLDGIADGPVVGGRLRISPGLFPRPAGFVLGLVGLPALCSHSRAAPAVLERVEVPRLGASFALRCLKHSFATDLQNLRLCV